jgi:hypothetical protein
MKKCNLLILLYFVLYNLSYSVTLSGFISDIDNGERLAFITVVITNSEQGAYTNKDGYFVINNIPLGEIDINISHINYEPIHLKKTIKDNLDDTFIRVEMKKKAILMETMTVTEERYKKKINSRDIVVSNIVQTTDELLDIPQIADADVFRAIQVLPGVSSISDFSSGLYIRGGSPDQNLILLDETDVYNPSHFGGIFSTFNTDAIASVELMKGGFPARYGGRLSSVMNVSNLDGNRKHHQGVARTSFISSSATIQGPWKIQNQSGSYMASFRRTYLELYKQFMPSLPDYYFYDGHVKLNWDVTEKDKLQTSFYFGKDALGMEMGFDALLDWGNETITTKWVHVFNPQLISNFIFAGSHYSLNFSAESDGSEKWLQSNDIKDGTFKSIFNYNPNDKHLIDFGCELKFNRITFQASGENTDIDDSGMPNVIVNSGTHSLFIQDSWSITNQWTLQPGLRFAYFTGKSPTLKNSPQADYVRISPRFSIRYKMNELSNSFFSYGRYYQYLTNMNPGISTPFDLWFPLDGSVKPGKSDHFIVGYQKQFSHYFAIEIDLYYKNYDNLVEYKPETDYEWNNETGNLSDIYNLGKGYSYGTDVLLRTDVWGLQGFIGYAYGQTKRKILHVNMNPETQENEWFYPRYDRTHQINIVETFNYTEQFDKQIFGAEFRIGATYSYGTGQPYMKPEQMYYDQDNLQILYSYSDRIRLADYSRFDLSFKLKWYFNKWTLEPYLQAINLFNNKNIWSIDYSYELANDGTIHLKEHKTSQFPFIPFLGFNIEW